MTSIKQVRANRRNAQASTGPRTDEGKTISRMNALKHGLTAGSWVLPTEDDQEHARLRQALLEDLAPVGALESEIADEIVNVTWRLRRGRTIEVGMLAAGVAAADCTYLVETRRRFETTEGDVRAYELEETGLDPDRVLAVTNPEVYEGLEELIDEARSVLRTEEVRLAAAFIDDASGAQAFEKLTRYEAALFRRRNELIALLARLQNDRAITHSQEQHDQ